MFSRQMTLFQAVACFLAVLFLLCSFSALAAEGATSEGGGWLYSASAFADAVVFIDSMFWLGDWLSPIDDWRAELLDLAEKAEFLRSQMTVAPDKETFIEYQTQLVVIEEEKQITEKKMNRFQRWFYPVVGVVATGIAILSLLEE